MMHKVINNEETVLRWSSYICKGLGDTMLNDWYKHFHHPDMQFYKLRTALLVPWFRRRWVWTDSWFLQLIRIPHKSNKHQILRYTSDPAYISSALLNGPPPAKRNHTHAQRNIVRS